MTDFNSIASDLKLASEALNRASEIIANIASQPLTQNNIQADDLAAQAEAVLVAERHPGRPGIRIEDNIDGDCTASSAVTTSPAPSLDEVRAALKHLCRCGFAADAQTIIGHYGVAKLPDVNPMYYRDLLAEVMTFKASHITTD